MEMLKMKDYKPKSMLIYGASVIGGLYGARLCQCGWDVNFLACRQWLAELRQNGIVLRLIDSRRHRVHSGNPLVRYR